MIEAFKPEDLYGVEIYTTDGLYVRQISVPKAGTMIPQHEHAWDHITMVAKGAVRAWKAGIDLGLYVAPRGIEIAAGIKHAFLTAEDNTVLYCLHNLHGEAAVKVLAEHDLIADGTLERLAS